MMKRKREEDDLASPTPKQALAIRLEPDENLPITESPTKRKRGRPPKNAPGIAPNIHVETVANAQLIESPTKKRRGRLLKNDGQERGVDEFSQGAPPTTTPKSQRRILFATPSKTRDEDSNHGTPFIIRNADRSARRKSARRLIERTIAGEESDDEIDEEDILAQKIWAADAEEEDEDNQDVEPTEVVVPETPSKRGRGRPKGSTKKKERSPTPPTDLPPNEQFFWQNRPGGAKTSNNTLTSRHLLNHDEYFAQMKSYIDSHKSEREFLSTLHANSFEQWMFELKEGFNICLYGYGSKRELVTKFATHVYDSRPVSNPDSTKSKPPTIIIINGYNATISIRDILSTIGKTVLPSSTKIPVQPAPLLQVILNHLSSLPPTQRIYIILNSIDAAALRRNPTPSILAALAAHSHVSFLATADTPTFPLLWDLGLRAQFRFLFHDATTFAPFDAAEIDSVEAVNELLGRSSRRVGGRDGVGFVLRSLPENARSLFRILVAEQLAVMDEGGISDFPTFDVATPGAGAGKPRAKPGVGGVEQGVEYRVLYHKAVEEFVCSNEVGFRTLLKEFHDHQMVESRKDAVGTERLVVPFRREELEGLIEDLVG